MATAAKLTIVEAEEIVPAGKTIKKYYLFYFIFY